MIPVLAAALAGGVIGACRRPLGAHLETPRLVLPGVLVAGVALHVLMGVVAVASPGAVLAASLGLLTTFTMLNRHLVGMGVLTLGLWLNLLVVAANHGMPVRASALVHSGAVAAGELADVDLGAGRHFERAGDVLPVLGDTIPVPIFGAAMSFGDLVVLMGTGSLAGEVVRYARRGSRRTPTSSLTRAAARLVHDWGTAPRPSPVSGFQYSAQPDTDEPANVLDLTDDATDAADGTDIVDLRSHGAASDLVAANHER